MSGGNLNDTETSEIIEAIISGDLNEVLAGAIFTALAMKGETVEELLGIVETMRKHMVEIKTDGVILDTCGTGGDGAHTINISTIVAFACASVGVQVAKHGNRSVSSKCGSFDVLEELGVNIEMDTVTAQKCLEEVGITCLFAPKYHPAMKHIAQVRTQLGVRTAFNFIGPLLNPAHATHQLIGVSNEKMAQKLGEIAMKLGLQKVILVHSDDGLDEISISAPTYIYEFVAGQDMKAYRIEPEQFFSLEDIVGGDRVQNAKIMKEILSGRGTLAQNMCIAMNAGMALYTVGKVVNFEEGKTLAYEILKSGIGMKKLEECIAFGSHI